MATTGELMSADAEEKETNGHGMLEVAMSRSAQEVQAAMIIAKRFPRDEEASYTKLMKACKRRGLAEEAAYTFPRGGQTVDGPSIRLAEAAARCWGNIDAGVIELERRHGESTAMAYAWDLETNSRDTKIFTVRHVRDTKSGARALTDERDIYEMVANQGARRKRACILAIIPNDVIDDAMVEINKTLAGDNKEPLQDRVRKMLVSFESVSVTQAMIEKRLGHVIAATTEAEFVALGKIFKSVRDGMAAREQFFEVGATDGRTMNLADITGKKSQETRPIESMLKQKGVIGTSAGIAVAPEKNGA